MERPQLGHRTWGGLALRGALAILFGILALARPGVTALGLIYLFGAYAFIDGVFAIVASLRLVGSDHWWAMLLMGIAGVGVGVLTYVAPAATAVGVLYYIAIWAVVTGVLEVVAAIRLRKVIEGEWLLGVAGVLAIAVGI